MMLLKQNVLRKAVAFALICALVVAFGGLAGAQSTERSWIVANDANTAAKITITRNRTNASFTVDGIDGVDSAQEYALADYGVKLEGLSGAKEVEITDNAEATDETVTAVYVALDSVTLSHETGDTTAIAVRGYSAAVLDVVENSAISSKIGTAAIEVNAGNAVTITSSTGRTLTVKGPNSAGSDGGAGAAIGASLGNDAGTIHITGNVRLYAETIGTNSSGSSNGAVIGGAGLTASPAKVGNGGTIIIDEDAVVSAVSHTYAAAIGGGWSKYDASTYAGGTGGNITIKGNATVTAKSSVSWGTSAAIGGATSGNGGIITI